MDRADERGQAKLLILAGALAALAVVAFVLQTIEPGHDSADLDGDPDGAYFDQVGFAFSCILGLSAYGLVIAACWRRLHRVPRLVPATVTTVVASRAFALAVVGSALPALEGVRSLVASGFWIVVATIALAGLATARIRRHGGVAWFFGVAVGTLIGSYLHALYELATP